MSASGPGAPAPFPAFNPPPYPYDRLAALAELATAAEGGMVDLSIGTPCDAPPSAAAAALGASGAERGYPASIGSPALRQAAARYLGRRFGVEVAPEALAACVGTKEFVASAAWYLRLRRPDRDTVLGPALAYPTYAMSATLAGCRYVGVPEAPGGGLDLEAVAAEDARRAVVLWVNSPANPSGAVSALGPAAAFGRRHDVPVCSDECYAEFTWSGPPATILEHGAAGVLAVHSLSKRSNFAGVRVGFYAGDGELVRYLGDVRRHAGLMVPGPVQAAAVAALDDDEHVGAQRDRYRRRLERLAEGLRSWGLEAVMPGGGFYLWVPVPAWAGGAWGLAEELARRTGMLVSPGDFYGEAGAGHLRIAVVAPDERIEALAERLERTAATRPGAGAGEGPGGLAAAR